MDYQIYQSLIDLKGENVMIIPVMFKQSSPPMKLYPLPPPKKKIPSSSHAPLAYGLRLRATSHT